MNTGIHYDLVPGPLGTMLLIWSWLPHESSSEWLNSRGLSWPAYLGRRFALAFLVMMPTTFLTGMTFPLVNRIGIRSLSRLGRGVGGLYFANTLGSIAGSLAAGFLLLALLGAHGALLATALLSVALGVLVHLARERRGALEPWLVAALFAGLLVATPALQRSGRSLLADTQEAADAVLFDAEDHAGETRVYRKAAGDIHMSVDGHHIGGTEPALLRKEKILAHLPMLLRPDAKKPNASCSSPNSVATSAAHAAGPRPTDSTTASCSAFALFPSGSSIRSSSFPAEVRFTSDGTPLTMETPMASMLPRKGENSLSKFWMSMQ